MGSKEAVSGRAKVDVRALVRGWGVSSLAVVSGVACAVASFSDEPMTGNEANPSYFPSEILSQTASHAGLIIYILRVTYKVKPGSCAVHHPGGLIWCQLPRKWLDMANSF